MKDFRGVEINIGDTVVYPGRHSSCLWMNEAIVTGFNKVDSYWGEGIIAKRVDSYQTVKISRIDRVCVLK